MRFYLTSIAIYAIIILATANLLAPMIKANGWLDSPKYEFNMSRFTVLFCASAVPVLRLLIVIAFMYMAGKKKD